MSHASGCERQEHSTEKKEQSVYGCGPRAKNWSALVFVLLGESCRCDVADADSVAIAPARDAHGAWGGGGGVGLTSKLSSAIDMSWASSSSFARSAMAL